MQSELYTVAQAAKYLQVCDKTIRRLIGGKILKASKVGKSWRINEADIIDYLNSQTNFKNAKESI
ncbi:MAG: helix-turn-helix domain-containing protein [Chlamydiales bacterium]|nr:helix-turn-helix domain-containing protein [Chlamydiales bacterium]